MNLYFNNKCVAIVTVINMNLYFNNKCVAIVTVIRPLQHLQLLFYYLKVLVPGLWSKVWNNQHTMKEMIVLLVWVKDIVE